MALNIAVSDVVIRAQALLNDQSASFWTTTNLLPHINSAYKWVFNNIATVVDVDFRAVTAPDIAYRPATPGIEQSLASILPPDMWLPIFLEFRLNQNEEWQPIDRRDKLPSRVTQQIERIWEWEWRGRSIWVNSSNTPGFLRITYHRLLPVLGLGSDPILFDNGLEAMAYYTAAQAFESRGQVQLASVKMGRPNPPTGALGYLENILQRLTLLDQEVGRRGSRFSQTGIDIVTTRFSG